MPEVASPVLVKDLAQLSRRLGARVRHDEPIGARTTYRVGGVAALYVEVNDPSDAAAIAEALTGLDADVLVFGAGSNLLVADEGFAGLCVAAGAELSTLEIDAASGRATAGAGLAYPQLARRLVAAGLSGMEWAVGIPGSVGGAVKMNAGGHGSDTAAHLVHARCYHLRDGVERIGDRNELGLAYRSSNVAAAEMVLDATFALAPDRERLASQRLAEIVAWRRAHQPGGRNGGSVFANPAGVAAGELIDAAGLKGLRVGSAVVSDKHANFFLVEHNGRAQDVYALIEQVRELVAQRFGIELVPELKLIGFTR